MTASLFIRIRNIIQNLGTTYYIKNDDAGEFHVRNESTRTIFKDEDEVLYCIRTSPPDGLGNGPNRKYVASVLEYDRIKTLEIDLSVLGLRDFLTAIGENPDDYNDFISSHSEDREVKMSINESAKVPVPIIDLSVK